MSALESVDQDDSDVVGQVEEPKSGISAALAKLHKISLEKAESEIAARNNDTVFVPDIEACVEACDFKLPQRLPDGHVAIPRMFGLSSFGRAVGGDLFALGDMRINVTGPLLKDLDIRVWLSIIAIAARQNSTVIEIRFRALARECMHSWGGDTLKRLWESILRLRRINITVSNSKGCVFDGALLGAALVGEAGVRITIVQDTISLLRGYCALDKVAWGMLSDAGRKIGGWALCQKHVSHLNREKWLSLLAWNSRTVKASQKDLRSIMANLETLGIVKSWSLERSGKLSIRR